MCAVCGCVCVGKPVANNCLNIGAQIRSLSFAVLIDFGIHARIMVCSYSIAVAQMMNYDLIT